MGSRINDGHRVTVGLRHIRPIMGGLEGDTPRSLQITQSLIELPGLHVAEGDRIVKAYGDIHPRPASVVGNACR